MKPVSAWFNKHYHYIPEGGKVLDLACGSGRHAEFLSQKGYQVTAVDIDLTAIRQLDLKNSHLLYADLEGESWPFKAAQFDAIIVVNYLWRPHFPKLKAALKAGGIIIFDTFMVGNEKFGRPSNPKFLLHPNELNEVFSEMEVLAFTEGYIENPSPAMRQSIIARKI